MNTWNCFNYDGCHIILSMYIDIYIYVIKGKELAWRSKPTLVKRGKKSEKDWFTMFVLCFNLAFQLSFSSNKLFKCKPRSHWSRKIHWWRHLIFSSSKWMQIEIGYGSGQLQWPIKDFSLIQPITIHYINILCNFKARFFLFIWGIGFWTWEWRAHWMDAIFLGGAVYVK